MFWWFYVTKNDVKMLMFRLCHPETTVLFSNTNLMPGNLTGSLVIYDYKGQIVFYELQAMKILEGSLHSL